MSRFIDFKLMKQYPNKYGFTPKNLKKLKVLDWDRLKKKCWRNKAMNDSKGDWYCHLEGDGFHSGLFGDDEDEFWIGFRTDGKVDYHFSSREGMCHYRFEEFYKVEEIENKYDMQIQVNAIKWLNMMIDEGILGCETSKS